MLDNLPCEAIFSVHLYGDSSDAILAPLQQAAGCHRIAVTEFGIQASTPTGDVAQLAYLQEKLRAFTRLGAIYATIYSLPYGPSDLDAFGLRRMDGTWKPGAQVFLD
jgi:hypothetical protein